MYLVAGLAAAVLVGIAAAFYFSIRSGKGGNKRLRPTGSGQTGAGRTGPGRGGAGRNGSGRAARASSRDYQPEDDSETNPSLDFGDPVLIGARRGGRGVSAGSRTGSDGRQAGTRAAEPASSRRLGEPASGRRPGERFEPDESQATSPGLVAVQASESGPGNRTATRLSRDAEEHEAGESVKPRRRMGFRKGADVDEELWPTEEFGGVSDEQFWDDLAADKPLTTTARTAQQDPGARKRRLGNGSATDSQARQAKRENQGRDGRSRDDRGRDDRGREDRGRDDRGRDDRGRDDRGRDDGRRAAGSGAYSGPESGPNPATEHTLIQPAYAGTQPVPSMTPQVMGATPVMGATQPVKTAAGGSQPAGPAGPPASAASRPTGAPARPAETRGRRRASSDEEDPLTSAAYSLRPSGPVDGRSSLRAGGSRSDGSRSDGSRSDGSRTGGSGPGSASTYGGTSSGSPYPFAETPHGDPSSATRATNTPPHGENYGYGHQGSAPAGDNPRRPNGTRSHARPTGASQNGQGTRPTRHAYPQDGYPAGNRQVTGRHQGTGSYPAPGYPGNGYPGSGAYPGNGRHGTYDPRKDYRRLTHRR